VRTIALTLAGILAVGVSVGSAQPSARATEVGWLGLFNQDLVQWLENENQRELYTPTGHLVLRTKYTRGC
jgi:hypothetical protein